MALAALVRSLSYDTQLVLVENVREADEGEVYVSGTDYF